MTPASAIRPRPVRWLWTDRIPAGEVTLTPGRGGIGKSTFHAWLIAKLTTGNLPGDQHGRNAPCVIAASEDSWERTIVPRLIASGADLDLVHRADVVIQEDTPLSLTLPADCPALEAELHRIGAVVLSVDPLMSAMAGSLDTHKDREVRHALEPLGRLADRTGVAVLGNAHFNKSNGSDPLNLITGSAAFGNVARAALGFARDTDTDDGTCVISQVKNNLGRLDLPSLQYGIEEATIATEEGPASVGRLVMRGESDRSVADILRDRGDPEDRGDVDAAGQWLHDLLSDGRVESNQVYRDADAAGLSKDQAKRAKKRLGVVSKRDGGSHGTWYWSLPDGKGSAKGAKSAGGDSPAPIAPLGPLCATCGEPLNPGHAASGEATHPFCNPNGAAS